MTAAWPSWRTSSTSNEGAVVRLGRRWTTKLRNSFAKVVRARTWYLGGTIGPPRPRPVDAERALERLARHLEGDRKKKIGAMLGRLTSSPDYGRPLDGVALAYHNARYFLREASLEAARKWKEAEILAEVERLSAAGDDATAQALTRDAFEEVEGKRAEAERLFAGGDLEAALPIGRGALWKGPGY